MPNVVRFTLSTARNLDVSGAGSFIAGVLDVDANNVAHVARVRYLVQPYRAVEVGIVDSATPPPSLPAVPASPAPDPYPQYVTDTDLSNPASGPSVVLRAAFEGLLDRTAAMPGLSALPVLHPDPPTVTAGVADAATAISGSVLTAPDEAGAFSYFGGKPVRGTSYPNVLGLSTASTYTGGTSAPSWAVETILDTVDATGRFELYVKGSGDSIRVLVQSETGRWQYLTDGPTFTQPSNGSPYHHLVTLGAPGVYTLRFEFTGNTVFFGIRTKPTDSLTATANEGRRVLVVGDSFTEPTIVDTHSSHQGDGWAQLLAYATGLDLWSAGSGGTGYLATLEGRPKFRDRIATDIVPHAPTEVWWFGGINDLAFPADVVAAEAKLCWAQVAAALPGVRQVVAGPWSPRGISSMPGSIINIEQALAQAAEEEGLIYLPTTLLPPSGAATQTTVATTASTSSNEVTVAGGWPGPEEQVSYVVIGDGTTDARVYGVTYAQDIGGGTTKLYLDRNAETAYTVGTTVRRSGGPLVTGTGNQGTPTGNGTADRFTGSDTTHPTRAGHRNLAMRVWQLLRAAAY